jgi:glycosyltransferase involved in cell wall biosynthesis
MKIAFFDNLANNAYGLAKIFRKQGYEADLIVDTSDTFPMSQPLWEDCDLTLDADRLTGRRLTRRYWAEKAQELDWKKPSWIRETSRKGKKEALRGFIAHPYRHRGSIWTALKNRSLFLCSLDSIRATMREYDVIVGSGLGPIYAYAAHTPFIHYPYGGDLTIVPFQTNDIAALQKTALTHATYVIVGDPGYFDYLRRLGIDSKGEFLPFMIDTDIYKPLRKNDALDSLDADLGSRIQNRFVFFVPSRQDFYWKSSDKILMAFAKLLEKKKDVCMILSGWGKDLGKAKEMVDRLNMKEYIYFLPYVLSKKRLRSFYSLADAVIDQFSLGAYGTSTMEAMACGRPVIMDFDMARYAPYFKKLPPVLTAKSVEEIHKNMLKLSDNERDLCEQIGKKSREWIMEFHGTQRNLDKIIRLCEESATKAA